VSRKQHASPSPDFKVWGEKCIFSGARFLFLFYVKNKLYKTSSGQNKIWERAKQIWGHSGLITGKKEK